MSLSLSLLIELSSLGSEWVKSVHDGLVGEWVLLSLVMNSDGGSNFSELGLNLVGVDDSGEIGTSHEVSVQGISSLLLGISEVGSENLVKLSESTSGENNQSSEVTTWSKLDDVKSVDIAGINSWQVSGGSSNLRVVVIIDKEWASLEDVSGVSVLSVSVSESL